MVRKIIAAVAIAIVLAATAAPAAAQAASVYQGTISTTYLTMFRDVVSSLPVTDDYVLFRSGESTYTLVAGDLDYSGTFTLNGEGKQYDITSVSGSGYSNSYYGYSVGSITSFTLTPGNYLVYSNLGDYPTLEERGVQYEFTTLFVLSVGCLAAFIHNIF